MIILDSQNNAQTLHVLGTSPRGSLHVLGMSPNSSLCVL